MAKLGKKALKQQQIATKRSAEQQEMLLEIVRNAIPFALSNQPFSPTAEDNTYDLKTGRGRGALFDRVAALVGMFVPEKITDIEIFTAIVGAGYSGVMGDQEVHAPPELLNPEPKTQSGKATRKLFQKFFADTAGSVH